MFEPKTVETAVVPRPFFATYMATRQLGRDVPDAASRVYALSAVSMPRRHRFFVISEIQREQTIISSPRRRFPCADELGLAPVATKQVLILWIME